MRQTNQDKILASLERYGPQCDDCLSESTLVRPRQQVHQICSHIAQTGLVKPLNFWTLNCTKFTLPPPFGCGQPALVRGWHNDAAGAASAD